MIDDADQFLGVSLKSLLKKEHLDKLLNNFPFVTFPENNYEQFLGTSEQGKKFFPEDR